MASGAASAGLAPSSSSSCLARGTAAGRPTRRRTETGPDDAGAFKFKFIFNKGSKCRVTFTDGCDGDEERKIPEPAIITTTAEKREEKTIEMRRRNRKKKTTSGVTMALSEKKTVKDLVCPSNRTSYVHFSR